MSSAEWYKTGSAGYEDAKRVQEERAAQYASFRFFLKPGKMAKVTFLDTEGFYFQEHSLQLGPKRWENFTCRADFSECPICESGHRPAYACAYTVIDHSEYEKSDGGVVKNQKKLLVIRTKVMDKLARKRAREDVGGDLRYCVFQFARDAKQECSTGEDIEFIKRLRPEEVARFRPGDSKESVEEFLKPFDYMTIFAPKSVEELRKLVGQAAPVGSDSYGGEASYGGAPIPLGASTVDEASIESLL
jgi:hypothetical protein